MRNIYEQTKKIYEADPAETEPKDDLPAEAPKEMRPDQAPKSNAEPGDEPVAPPAPPSKKPAEKEFLGNSGENSFYLVRKTDEGDNTTDLIVTDAEGKELLSARRNNLAVTDEKAFILQAAQELDIDRISYDIMMNYFAKEEDTASNVVEPQPSLPEEPKPVESPEKEMPKESISIEDLSAKYLAEEKIQENAGLPVGSKVVSPEGEEFLVIDSSVEEDGSRTIELFSFKLNQKAGKFNEEELKATGWRLPELPNDQNAKPEAPEMADSKPDPKMDAKAEPPLEDEPKAEEPKKDESPKDMGESKVNEDDSFLMSLKDVWAENKKLYPDDERAAAASTLSLWTMGTFDALESEAREKMITDLLSKIESGLDESKFSGKELRKISDKELNQFVNRPGVKKIAVENFLSTVDGLNSTEALANLAKDAALYKWNAETVIAIKDGIRVCCAPVSEAKVEEMALKGTKYVVTAQAFDRKTNAKIGKERKETIDIAKNELFQGVKNIGDIESKYESFWNDLNPSSKEIVKVSAIKALGESVNEMSQEQNKEMADADTTPREGHLDTPISDAEIDKMIESADEDELHFGFQNSANVRLAKAAIMKAGISFTSDSNMGITYLNFKTAKDLKKAASIAGSVIDKSKEDGEWGVDEAVNEEDRAVTDKDTPRSPDDELPGKPGSYDKVIFKVPFSVADIADAYVGKPNTCMCGCAGNYFRTTAGRNKLKDDDYRKDEPANDAKVQRIYNKMKKNASMGIEVIDNYIYTLTVGSTQYSIYLLKGKNESVDIDELSAKHLGLPKMDNTCDQCGKEGTKFAGDRDQEFCSKECMDKWNENDAKTVTKVRVPVTKGSRSRLKETKDLIDNMIGKTYTTEDDYEVYFGDPMIELIQNGKIVAEFPYPGNEKTVKSETGDGWELYSGSYFEFTLNDKVMATLEFDEGTDESIDEASRKEEGLAALKNAIEKRKKLAAEETEAEMKNLYRGDARDLETVYKAFDSGDMKKFNKLVNALDTEVRELIPSKIINKSEDWGTVSEALKDAKEYQFKGKTIIVYRDGDDWTWKLKNSPNSYGPGEGPDVNRTSAEALKSAKDYLRVPVEEAASSKTVSSVDPDYAKEFASDIADREVFSSKEFPASGTFGAISAAEEYLKSSGYTKGSMNSDYPIGFIRPEKTEDGNMTTKHGESRSFIITKWDRLSDEQKADLDGVIIPTKNEEGQYDFREGGAILLFFSKDNPVESVVSEGEDFSPIDLDTLTKKHVKEDESESPDFEDPYEVEEDLSARKIKFMSNVFDWKETLQMAKWVAKVAKKGFHNVYQYGEDDGNDSYVIYAFKKKMNAKDLEKYRLSDMDPDDIEERSVEGLKNKFIGAESIEEGNPKFANVDWTRKPVEWSEIEEVEVDPALLANVKSFSMEDVYGVEVGSKEATEVKAIDSFYGEDSMPQYFILDRDGVKYLVNTEGYDYARYVVRLPLMNNESKKDLFPGKYGADLLELVNSGADDESPEIDKVAKKHGKTRRAVISDLSKLSAHLEQNESVNIADGKWHRIAVTVSEGVRTLYVDGKKANKVLCESYKMNFEEISQWMTGEDQELVAEMKKFLECEESDEIKVLEDFSRMFEVSPAGWENAIKGMKKNKEIDNPWALSYWMKNRGYKPKRKR